jgi:hypothetical protein
MSDSSKIYASSLDGNSSHLFSAIPANEILADSNGIYFIDKSDRSISLLDMDGVQLTSVVEGGNASKLSSAYNLLFYVNYSNAKDMYQISKN